MSEQNIYKDHYELQRAYEGVNQSLHNIYAILHPFVAPHGVQLSLQEVVDLVAQKLSGGTDVHASEPQPEKFEATCAEDKPAE